MDSIKSVWKNLKDQFRRVSKKVQKVTGPDAEDPELPQNWEFFEQMSFLLDQDRHNDCER